MEKLYPAFTINNVPIVLASSAYYVPYMVVTIISIMENSTVDNNYDFIILHKEIDAKEQMKICKNVESYKNCSIRFLKVSEDLTGKEFNFRKDVASAQESFYCVLLQEILTNYKKVICLDCDVIVLKDIAQLYHQDVSGYLIAATKDPDGIGNSFADLKGINTVEKMKGRADYLLNILKLDSIDSYFQSGVMLLNLDEWRKTYTLTDILSVACADWIQWGDQDTMNVLCRNKVKYLDLRWNLIINDKGKQLKMALKSKQMKLVNEYLDARANPYIIHFAGSKPWLKNNVDFDKVFWRYASVSSYFDTIKERIDNRLYDSDRKSNELDVLLSVIIPVYNTEEYLEETIESVINQTLNFERHIQLILVNNASEDNSDVICKYYKSIYPNNIEYVVLENNKGPSGARNAGLKYAKGKYVNFLDSDDKWAPDALKKAINYLEKNETSIDLVACRIKHFDASKNWHVLDYKFKKNHICDIFLGVDHVQLSLCSTVIKRDAIRFELDETIHHAEDAKFLTQIILDKCKYGILSDSVFYYRKRSTGISLLQSTSKSSEWYFETPYKVYKYILDLSKELFGYAIPYVQYLCMYEIQWRLKTEINEEFNHDEKNKYKEIIAMLLQEIDDQIIMEQKNISNEYKIFCLHLKYEKLNNNYLIRNNKYYKNNICLIDFKSGKTLTITNLEIANGQLKMSGRINLPVDHKDITLYVQHNDVEISVKLVKAHDETAIYPFGEEYMRKSDFHVVLPLTERNKISFKIGYAEYKIKCGFWCGRFAKISNKMSNSYYYADGYIARYSEQEITIENVTWFEEMRAEYNFQKEIFKKYGLKKLFYRVAGKCVALNKRLSKKNIWLISDRLMSANDNGKKLYTYLKEKNVPQKLIFVLKKDSIDYFCMKKIGAIISPTSFFYKLYYLRANKQIAAYLDNPIVYPFSPDNDYIKDLLPDNLIYLQHGIIKDDFSVDQNRANKNIQRFVTSARTEKNSILNNPYGYLEENVLLTGLARHDMLELNVTNNEKIILLAPTWRSKLEGTIWNSEEGVCGYNEKFIQSEYYKFYDSLINDDKLLECLKKNGYIIVLKLHPVIKIQSADFHLNNYVYLEQSDANSIESINKSNMVITDYSSIAFDFAYCKKSCIYTHFDKDVFYKQHGYNEGYFDYETMGFGPVCYDYESTVQAIIHAIENNCVMEDMYKERVDNFFAYRDGKNCERIYQEILKLDKGE